MTASEENACDVQTVRTLEEEHPLWKRPQARAAMVVAVALAAAGASLTFISQDPARVAGAALAVLGIVTVTIAWVAVGPVFAARLLALGQGMVWFFLLIHGGLGLVFGPMGWAASVSGNRLAAALLTVPAAFLAISWLPLVSGADGLGLSDGLTILAVIAPALVAAGVFVRAHLHQEEKPVT